MYGNGTVPGGGQQISSLCPEMRGHCTLTAIDVILGTVAQVPNCLAAAIATIYYTNACANQQEQGSYPMQLGLKRDPYIVSTGIQLSQCAQE